MTRTHKYAVIITILSVVLTVFLTFRIQTPLNNFILVSCSGLFCILECILCFISYKKSWTPQRLFLWLFLPLSFIMMVVMPVGRVPDEDSHLQRIWLISQGQWLPWGLTQPIGLLDGINDTDTTLHDISNHADQNISEERTDSDAGFNTGIYPPISYVLQSVAVTLMKTFTSNRIQLLYAARIGGWLATILLLYLAVKMIPWGKYSLIAISIMPIMLQQGMSASVDGLAFGAVSLLLAWILHHRQQAKLLSFVNKLQISMISLLVVTCKMIYIPCLLLLLALPATCWGSTRKKVIGTAIIWCAMLTIIMGWLLFCYVNYVSGQHQGPDGTTGLSIIIPQLVSIITHPFQYASVFVKTILSQSIIWIHTMLGSGMSALNIHIPMKVLILETIGLLIVFFLDNRMPNNGYVPVRYLSLISSLLSVTVMLTALYLWWNPYQSSIIEGMQGRYLIPLLLPILLIIPPLKVKIQDHNLAPLSLMLCLPSAISSAMYVLNACL